MSLLIKNSYEVSPKLFAHLKVLCFLSINKFSITYSYTATLEYFRNIYYII